LLFFHGFRKKLMKEITYCPHCKSTGFVKNGYNYSKRCYLFKSCGYNFTIRRLKKGIDPEIVRLCLKLY